MNYELAEKLYKAGFPGIKCSEESPTPGYSYPTLEELIEACGDRFSCLIRHKKGSEFMPIGKRGEEAKALPWEAREGDWRKDNREFGETPSEAVANLWLKLNEK